MLRKRKFLKINRLTNKFYVIFISLFFIFLFSYLTLKIWQNFYQIPFSKFKPLKKVFLFENHSHSYVIWKKYKIKNKILVHIDTHSDIKKIDDKSLLKIINTTNIRVLETLECYPDKHYDRIKKPLTIGNFIYAALKDGIVKEYYWIVPDLKIDDKSVDTYNRYFMKRLQDISFKKFKKIEGNIYQSYIGNIPVNICRLKDLPEFNEPVLLDIDVDYFVYDSGATQKRLIHPEIFPEELVNTLIRKNIKIDLVTIAFAIKSGHTPLEYRYFGEELYKIFHNPDSIDNDYKKLLKYKKKALVYKAKGRYEKAAKEIKKALKLKPDDASSHYILSLIYYQQKSYEKSSQELLKAINLDKAYKDFFLYRATVFLNDKLYDRAANLFQEALRLSPDNIFINYKLGICNLQIGFVDKAIQNYKKLISLKPEIADFHIGLGHCYLKKGLFQEAIEEYKIGIRINPNLPVAHNNLGLCFYKLNDFKKAAQEFNKAIKINICYVKSYINLGNIYQQTGMLNEAIKKFRVALKIAPEDIRVLNNLGICYARKGLYKKARNQWEDILKISPDYADAKINLQKLEVLERNK